MSTFSSAQSDTAAVSDLGAWNEKQLIAAAQIGRKAPFGELVERHQKRVFCVTRLIMPNREDAEDAMQDCFLNAFLHLKDFDGRSKFVTWLTRIAINAALAKLRKKRVCREVAIDEPNPSSSELGPHLGILDDAPDPEEIYRHRERKQIVNAALSLLRPHVRKAVEIHKLQEHSVKETARILGISAAAVKARVFHAKATLYQMALLQSVARANRADAS